MTKRIPVGKCPSCNHPLIYSSEPSSKWRLVLKIAEDDFQGHTVMCAKCKQMIAIIECPVRLPEPIAVPSLKSV